MFKVCIDPGHGGADRANRGPTGYIEADGNLKVARFLKDELSRAGAFYVMLTRTADSTVGLRERANRAADFGADLFLSIHSDACNGKSRGPVSFYSVDLPGDRQLANDITAAIAKAFGTVDRGGRTRAADPASPGATGATKADAEDYYAVIDQAQDRGIPHVVLVEMMFHDNPAEEVILKDDANLKKIAQIMAGCICKTFGVAYDAGHTLSHDILAISGYMASKAIEPLTLDYWRTHAVPGQTCDGAFVAEAFRRIATALGK